MKYVGSLFTILILFVIQVVSAQAQTYTIAAYADNENTGTTLHENRINLIFLADGWPENQTGTDNFQYRVAQVVGDEPTIDVANPTNDQYYGFKHSSPFKEYWRMFEAFEITVTGFDEGVKHPCDPNAECNWTSADGYSYCVTCNETDPDNAFGSTWDYQGLHRYMHADATKIATAYTETGVSTTAPKNAIVMANNVQGSEQCQSGGGGGDYGAQFLVVSANYIPAATNGAYGVAGVVVHEIAHSFFGLKDEYYYPETAPNDVGPNKTTNNDISDSGHPWHDWNQEEIEGQWVPTRVVDNYQHRTIPDCSPTSSSYYTNVNSETNPLYYNLAYGNYVTTPSAYYKPTDEYVCKMEQVQREFCPVCKEAILYKIWDELDAVEAVSPAENTSGTAFASSSALEFEISEILESTPSYMRVEWYFNGVLVETDFADGSDPGVTEYKWEFDCSLLDGLTFGNVYTVEAKILDMTGPTGEELIRLSTHAADHTETYTWHVEKTAEAEMNLMIRDFYQQQDNSQLISDVGDEPWLPFPLEGWFFDYTSDIKVSPTSQGSTPFDDIEHASPLGSEITAYVNVRIENIGCSNFSSADKLHLYTSTNGGGLSWPSLWEGAYTGTGDVGYEITHNGSVPVPATIPDIDGGGTAVVEIPWYIEDMTPNAEEDWNPCLMARIEDVTEDPIDDTSPASDHLTNWIRFNNNIAMRNLTVDEPDGQGQNLEVIDGRPYSGGYTYLGNTSSVQDTFVIRLQHGLQPSGNPDITDEAEVILYFKEDGWAVSDALDAATMKDGVKLDSTLYRSSGDLSISGLVIPADTVVPVFVGFAFLTEEVGDSMNYVIHLNQRLSSGTDTIDWAQHYLIKRNSRTLFTADAGSNETILSGDTVTLTATDIGEDALYFWLNEAGEEIGTGDEIDVSPSANTTYTLEVIAEDDGYKDYDDVTVTVTNGLITSVAPNPASSTTTVDYETTGVSTVKLKVVDTGTMIEVDNFTVTAGTGSKVITVSGYNTGTHIITLEGDSQDLDSKTLIVQ